MNRVTIFFFAFFSIFLTSCSDDDTQTIVQEETEAGFYALSVGNTWTYQFYNRDFQTDIFEPTEVFEKVEITGTEEIDGATYYVQTTTKFGDDVQYPSSRTIKLRDSLGYLINEGGFIYFSERNTNTYFIRNFDELEIYGFLLPETTDLSVPAGNFTVKENEVYAIEVDGSIAPGKARNFYATGVGKIQENNTAISNSRHFEERRLISYELVEN